MLLWLVTDRSVSRVVIFDVEQRRKLEKLVDVLEDNLDVVVPIPALVLNLQLRSTIVAPGNVELADLLARERIEALLAVAHHLCDGEDNGLVDEHTVLVSHELSSDVGLEALSLRNVDQALEANAGIAGPVDAFWGDLMSYPLDHGRVFRLRQSCARLAERDIDTVLAHSLGKLVNKVNLLALEPLVGNLRQSDGIVDRCERESVLDEESALLVLPLCDDVLDLGNELVVVACVRELELQGLVVFAEVKADHFLTLWVDCCPYLANGFQQEALVRITLLLELFASEDGDRPEVRLIDALFHNYLMRLP